MTASTHLAVGAAASVAIQKYLPNSNKTEKLFFGFMAGFASHLLLDSFPHQEYGVGGLALILVLLGEITGTFYLLLSFRKAAMANLIIFFGMAGGAIPDFLYFFSRIFLNRFQSEELTTIIHLFSHEALPLGFEVSMYIQATFAILAFWFIKKTPAK